METKNREHLSARIPADLMDQVRGVMHDDTRNKSNAIEYLLRTALAARQFQHRENAC